MNIIDLNRIYCLFIDFIFINYHHIAFTTVVTKLYNLYYSEHIIMR